ncbi:hypothetical protein POVWA1_009910 [Plasmodium ovale wallikeri]|uniref:Uncharacterized protein n=1 Tax=Plasmodium ovale wallikeri TaxID=864142 RepID=A0A1A8YKA3_PLAOA|nr:hypothetical protein POVWA1_009910 [Plasmodium ovale wallikeri]
MENPLSKREAKTVHLKGRTRLTHAFNFASNFASNFAATLQFHVALFGKSEGSTRFEQNLIARQKKKKKKKKKKKIYTFYDNVIRGETFLFPALT